MQITLSPMRGETPLTAERRGNSLVLNGEDIDLVAYSAGDSPWIVGQPVQVADLWRVTLILPHGANATEETLFPAQIAQAEDGLIALPPYDAPPIDA